MWALVATFIKATTDTLTQFGVAGMFTHWPIYALAVGASAALLLMQAALHVGPLRASQPFIVIIDPIVSIALSVWLFGEHFTADGAALALAAAGFAVMCAGVVALTQTAPATMTPDIPEDKEGGEQHGAEGSQARPAGRRERPAAGGTLAETTTRPTSTRFRKDETGGTAVLLTLFLIGLASRPARGR
jgi:hypothetical protein